MCIVCDPKARKKRKTKENLLAKGLEEGEITFQREIHIGYTCSELETENKKSAYIDFVIERPTHRILLECDESQHKDRIMSCEMARMAWLMESIQAGGNTRPTLWIRFNPDAYRVGGELQKNTQEGSLPKTMSRNHQGKTYFTILLSDIIYVL